VTGAAGLVIRTGAAALRSAAGALFRLLIVTWAIAAVWTVSEAARSGSSR
jgi:hypothetical protein